MRRRDFITLLGGVALTWTGAARAQQPHRVRRVGVLDEIPDQESPGFAAFRKHLGELRYVEGQNIAIEYRWSDKAERQLALAVELMGLKVDVIVTGDTTTLHAAELATKDVPIVVAVFDEDPVSTGLVDSLRRPGGNITGLSILAPEMGRKRLELLRQIVPDLKSIAVLLSMQSRYQDLSLLRETGLASRHLGLSCCLIAPVEGSEEIEDAFRRIIKEHADAIDVFSVPQFFRIRTEIAELGLKYRLPIISGLTGFAQLGGLIQYGPSMTDNWRQAAVYVDKILNGEKPADLPVSQPTKLELVINLKTAKALGLTVPPTLLATADEVIE